MGWVAIDKTWHDTTVDHCEVCGNLLIRRAWAFTAPDGRVLRACRPEDERLLATLERHAPAIDEARGRWAEQSPVGRTPDPEADPGR